MHSEDTVLLALANLFPLGLGVKSCNVHAKELSEVRRGQVCLQNQKGRASVSFAFMLLPSSTGDGACRRDVVRKPGTEER